ncbi:hypothetical protein HAX54_013345 [Datura stramonium]|uniref:Uncharacterized protein n=1 Tax=Datura stramonium TaxID=4076 RepID=A0ABS8TM48_DATST|nr:hypothetical protein [Datura stramonium]
MEGRGLGWVMKSKERMQAYHPNHQGVMGSIESQRKKLRMNGVTEEQLQQLNIDYPLREHSIPLYRGGPRFEEPLDDNDATYEEQTRVGSDLDSNDDGDDSKMGEAAIFPIDDEK